jgi:hypothetical protein
VALSVPQGLAALGAVLAAAAKQPCSASTPPVHTAAAHISWPKLLQAASRTAEPTPAFLAEVAEQQADSERMLSPTSLGRGGPPPRLASTAFVRASMGLEQLQQVVRETAGAIAGRPIGADEPLVAAGAGIFPLLPKWQL